MRFLPGAKNSHVKILMLAQHVLDDDDYQFSLSAYRGLEHCTHIGF